jgi:hypothetical protein
LRGAPRVGKPGSFIDGRKYTRPGSNWRPSACQADVIATRPLVPWLLRCQEQGNGINGLTPWHLAREGRGVDVSMHACMHACMHARICAMPCRLRAPRPSTFHGSRYHSVTSLSVGVAHRAHGATVRHLTADHKIGFSSLPAPMLPPHALHPTTASTRKTRGSFPAIATKPHQQNTRQPHQLEHQPFQMQGGATFDAKPIRRFAAAAAGPRHHGAYSSVVERQSCKLMFPGSIPSQGFFLFSRVLLAGRALYRGQWRALPAWRA